MVYSKNTQKIHFIHIGKTGGTAVKYALQDYNATVLGCRYEIILHNHNFKLKDIPIGEKFFFFVREPIDRFISGFYSRKRQGRPKYDSPWSESEEKAFSYFDTPNTLAKALTSISPIKRKRAKNAMRNISHVNSSYWDWFENEKYFTKRKNDLFFVGRQSCLEIDFEVLKNKLGSENAKLPKSKIDAHKNPNNLDKYLTEESIKNLKKWLHKEYLFLKMCDNLYAK